MEISSSSRLEWYNFMVLLHNSGIPYSFFDTINKYNMSKYDETKNNQCWHSLSKSRITLKRVALDLFISCLNDVICSL